MEERHTPTQVRCCSTWILISTSSFIYCISATLQLYSFIRYYYYLSLSLSPAAPLLNLSSCTSSCFFFNPFHLLYSLSLCVSHQVSFSFSPLSPSPPSLTLFLSPSFLSHSFFSPPIPHPVTYNLSFFLTLFPFFFPISGFLTLSSSFFLLLLLHLLSPSLTPFSSLSLCGSWSLLDYVFFSVKSWRNLLL